MFIINEDMSIYVTRGDSAFFTVTAEENGANYVFKKGDVVRFKAFAKKDCEEVVLQKDFAITEDREKVDIFLSGTDTKFGDVISKPLDYWYEVELNPFTDPQTIIGYDDDGAKIMRLFPEGKDIVTDMEEEIPPVDAELDLASTRPIQNQAVARALSKIEDEMAHIDETILETASEVLKDNPIQAKLEYNPSTEELTLVLTSM